jgi:hypothetical protein
MKPQDKVAAELRAAQLKKDFMLYKSNLSSQRSFQVDQLQDFLGGPDYMV